MALPHDIAIELDRMAERILALADPNERSAAIKRFKTICAENQLDPDAEARKRTVTL